MSDRCTTVTAAWWDSQEIFFSKVGTIFTHPQHASACWNLLSIYLPTCFVFWLQTVCLLLQATHTGACRFRRSAMPMGTAAEQTFCAFCDEDVRDLMTMLSSGGGGGGGGRGGGGQGATNTASGANTMHGGPYQGLYWTSKLEIESCFTLIEIKEDNPLSVHWIMKVFSLFHSQTLFIFDIEKFSPNLNDRPYPFLILRSFVISALEKFCHLCSSRL